MSKTSKKELREENTTLSRAQKAELEDAKHAKNSKIYLGLTLLMIVCSLAAVVWNQGIIQKSATAAVIGGEEISVAEMGYYYNTARMNEVQNLYYGMSDYNPDAKDKDQMYDDTDTFADYFMDSALEAAQGTYALLNAAKADGYTVDPALVQSEIDSTLASLDQQALSNNLPNAEAYLKAQFGKYMDMATFEEMITQQVTAIYYVQDKQADFTVSEDDKESYYSENADALDTYTISYMVLQAKEQTSTEDNPLTADEIAADFARDKELQKANADAALADLNSGEDMESLGDKYDAYGCYVSDVVMGNQMNTSLTDWAFSADRQAGDLTIADYESEDTVNYYVARFEGRERDDTPTANVRHILVSAGAAPTEAEYDEAKARAESVLEQWKGGDATADSFGDLAMLNSADTQSAQSGGVITGLTPTSAYVETFRDWATDTARQPGDTGLVKNEVSSIKGWHVMYFESWADPQWSLLADQSLLTERMTAWNEALIADTTAELAAGTKYVG